jgi:hypothetical protein
VDRLSSPKLKAPTAQTLPGDVAATPFRLLIKSAFVELTVVRPATVPAQRERLVMPLGLPGEGG